MKLKCPQCKKPGFTDKQVWYPDQPESRLKCPHCGEWSKLVEWQNSDPFKMQHIATKVHIRNEITRQWDNCERIYVADVLKIIDGALYENLRNNFRNNWGAK